MKSLRKAVWWTLVALGVLSGAGCATTGPRAVDPEDAVPLLRAAFESCPDDFDRACARTIAWLDTQPRAPGAADRRAAIARLRVLLARAADADAFAWAVCLEFDVLRMPAPVHFTAYYAPEFSASERPNDRHRAALHRRPDALPPGNPDELAWHTRAEIARDGLLDDRAIAWLDPMDAYLAQVNGSVRLRFEDGRTVTLAHDGTNGRPYRSLGQLMVEKRLLPVGGVTMQSIRAEYARRPADVEALMLENERSVFFQPVPANGFPRSGLGVALLPETALATDKSTYPGGDVMLVDTTVPDPYGVPRPFERLVLDLDRGGAIQGPSRADIYLGVGPEAGARAGRTRATGDLYVLRLKR